jgi:hypothetical protein
MTFTHFRVGPPAARSVFSATVTARATPHPGQRHAVYLIFDLVTDRRQ